MIKRLFLSSAVSAIWLVFAFVTGGALYLGIGFMIDPSGLMQFQDAWGYFRFDDHVAISKVGVLVIGVIMFLACLPINLYWMRKMEEQ